MLSKLTCLEKAAGWYIQPVWEITAARRMLGTKNATGGGGSTDEWGIHQVAIDRMLTDWGYS